MHNKCQFMTNLFSGKSTGSEMSALELINGKKMDKLERKS